MLKPDGGKLTVRYSDIERLAFTGRDMADGRSWEAWVKKYAERKDPRGEQGNPIMASMLKSVDDSLGRVVDHLDKLGLTDDTIFIFFSDNGGNTHSNTAEDAKQQRG